MKKKKNRINGCWDINFFYGKSVCNFPHLWVILCVMATWMLEFPQEIHMNVFCLCTETNIVASKGFIELGFTTVKKGKIDSCLCHKIYRVEAVVLYLSNNAFKITIFVSMWNQVVSWKKKDILSISAKNPFAHMGHM